MHNNQDSSSKKNPAGSHVSTSRGHVDTFGSSGGKMTDSNTSAGSYSTPANAVYTQGPNVKMLNFDTSSSKKFNASVPSNSAPQHKELNASLPSGNSDKSSNSRYGNSGNDSSISSSTSSARIDGLPSSHMSCVGSPSRNSSKGGCPTS